MKMDYRLDPPDEIDDGFDPPERDADRENDLREDRKYDDAEFYRDDGDMGD